MRNSLCNLEKKPCEDTVDQTDNEESSLTFMMMEIASDGFPGRSKSKVRQANDTREHNHPEHTQAAGGGGEVFKNSIS